MKIREFFATVRHSNKYQVTKQKTAFVADKARKFILKYLLFTHVIRFLRWLNPPAQHFMLLAGRLFLTGFVISLPLTLLLGFPFTWKLWTGIGIGYWVVERQVLLLFHGWASYKLKLAGYQVNIQKMQQEQKKSSWVHR